MPGNSRGPLPSPAGGLGGRLDGLLETGERQPWAAGSHDPARASAPGGRQRSPASPLLSESESALAGTHRRASLWSLERPPEALDQHPRTDSGSEWGARPPPWGLRGAFAHWTVTSGLHAGCGRLRPEEHPLTPGANPQLHLRALL